MEINGEVLRVAVAMGAILSEVDSAHEVWAYSAVMRRLSGAVEQLVIIDRNQWDAACNLLVSLELVRHEGAFLRATPALRWLARIVSPLTHRGY
jgi:hypothetical protein